MTTLKQFFLTLTLAFSVTACFAQAPVAHYTADCKTLCLNGPRGLGNTTLNFTYNGTGGTPTSYSWAFPAGTVPATSTTKSPQGVDFTNVTAGGYLVTVTATNGTDTSSFADSIFIVKKCQANYNGPSIFSTICPGTCLTFSDHSNFQPDTWTWTFGTPRGDTVVYSSFANTNITICYPTGGNYSLEVKATRSNNCFFQNDFNPGPVIKVLSSCLPIDSVKIIGADSICAGQSSSFSGTPVHGGLEFATYKWSFPGVTPSSSSSQMVDLAYPTPGNYTIRLIVSNDTITDTIYKTITVYNCSYHDVAVLPDYSPICICGENSIAYDVTGSFYNDNVFTLQLSNSTGSFNPPKNIGNDTSNINGAFTADIPCNIAAGSGYKVRIISSHPAYISAAFPITISDSIAPTSTFVLSTDTTCSNVLVTYTGNGDSTSYYTWNFDGGVKLSNTFGQGPYSVLWPTLGTKTIKLHVFNAACTSITTTHTVFVSQEPTSTFTADKDTVCTTSIFTFTGTASPSATFKWTLDDGTGATTNGKGPKTVTWKTQGEKTITLTVTDKGCVSDIYTVHVYASICTGVNTITADNAITIYPNPVSNRLVVSGSNKLLGGNLTVTDVIGRTILFKDKLAAENNIDVRTLITGVYFVTVNLSNGQSVVKKFVKE